MVTDDAHEHVNSPIMGLERGSHRRRDRILAAPTRAIQTLVKPPYPTSTPRSSIHAAEAVIFEAVEGDDDKVSRSAHPRCLRRTSSGFVSLVPFSAPSPSVASDLSRIRRSLNRAPCEDTESANSELGLKVARISQPISNVCTKGSMAQLVRQYDNLKTRVLRVSVTYF